MKDIVAVFLFLCEFKSCFSSFCSSASQNPTNSWNFNKNADKGEIGFRFFAHSFRSPTGYDVYHCAYHCESDPRCKSFNFLSEENVCELNKADRKSVKSPKYVQLGESWLTTKDGLVAYKGSQYFSKDVYTLKSKELLGACHSSPCPKDHACSSISNNDYQCQKIVFTKQDFLEQWGEWGPWSSCPVTCGTGVQERTRQCGSPDFWLCEGKESERKLCDINPSCPIWSQWSSWSECELDDGCGWGKHNRTRVCMHSNSTSACVGDSNQTNVCRAPSCDTPAMLSNGTNGDVYIYDDTYLYNPMWRQVCEPDSELTLLTVKMTICSSLGLSVADDDVLPTVIPNNDDLVFKPVVCGLNERRLMRCIHNGLIEARNCSKILAVNCTESSKRDVYGWCLQSNDLTFACDEGNDIKIRNGYFGRKKGSTDCGVSTPFSHDCFDNKALQMLKNICDDRPSCNLRASQFGDPCPGFESYLDVEYFCVKRLLPFYAGLKDGRIDNDQFEVSSKSAAYQAWFARLDNNRNFYDVWASEVVAKGQWIQIDFKNPVYILGVITKGRKPEIKDQRVTSFNIAYGNKTNEMVTFKSSYNNEDKAFLGNIFLYVYSTNIFERPIFARYIRLIAQEWKFHISLNMEYLVATP